MSEATRHRPFVHTPARGRLLGFGSAFVAAAAVVVFAPAWMHSLERVVSAYDAGAVILLSVYWTLGMHAHPEDTACRAAVEDPGRHAVLVLVLMSIVGAFASAVAIIGHDPHVGTPLEKALVYVIGLAAVVLGWFLIHTLLAFRYAHLYYFDDDGDNVADGGLVFPGTRFPNDYDFAYFSFVIGMTFQVSDVQVTDPGVRRLVLFHGLISFAYNTSILALVVNLASGLLGH